MSSKIPKTVVAALAQRVRENPDRLRNLVFGDSTTSLTVVKTQDLQFDVHKNTQNPNMATGIIQANSEAENRAVKSFIKGSTGGHKGTHQVIGEKIRFGLGASFDVEAVANAIERGGDSGVEPSTSAATGGPELATVGWFGLRVQNGTDCQIGAHQTN
jgi:hypothetical protein